MRMMFKTTPIKMFALLALGVTLNACEPTPTPDYTIQVKSTPQGIVAVPPACLDFTTATANPFDNQPMPQFGCANARNLAFMVERPNDLIQGRDFGDSRGVMAVGAMRRYDNNQTRGLLDVGTAPDSSLAVTSAPTASSSMSGDAAAGGGSGASAGGGSAAPAAAAAAP